MPPNPDLIRLRHMLDAIAEAKSFARGTKKADLAVNRMLALALIKEIELIGEAASKVSAEMRKKYPQVLWKEAIATRNRLIHGYFDIDIEAVWGTLEHDLPAMESALKKILGDEE